jgi:hypothetical protein
MRIECIVCYVHTYTLQNSKDGVGGVTSPGPGTVWRRDTLSGLQCNANTTTLDGSSTDSSSTDTSSYAFDWRLQPETVGHQVKPSHTDVVTVIVQLLLSATTAIRATATASVTVTCV